MNDDDLLKRLGDIARERQDAPIDPRWERLARGELTEAERDALLAEEGAEGAALAPLGPDFEARMTESLLADLPQKRRPWVLPVLALAAAMLLWVAVPGGSTPGPGYTLETRGAQQTLRSGSPEDGGPQSFTTDAELEILLRPETPVEDAVSCSAWLRDDTGQTRSWPGTLEVSPSGAVRLTGTVGAGLGLAPGRHEVLIALDPEGPLSLSEAEARVGAAAPSWPAWKIPLVVQAP